MPTYFMRTYGQTAGFGDPWTNDMDTAMLDLTPELIDLCRQRSVRVLALAALRNRSGSFTFGTKGAFPGGSSIPVS
jgi:hypothetical protein